MAFVQEAAEEYLAGRTMNAIGQRIIHSSSDDSASDEINQRAQRIIAETGKAVRDYSKVVNYNTSKMNYIGDEWVKNAARQEGGSDVLFRKAVAFSAAAGFALAAGVGAAIVAHLASVRAANIGISLAFVGLLVFIALTGIAFINLNAMGEVNAEAVQSLEDVDENKSDVPQNDRVGAVQRFTVAGARYNMVSDFVKPVLDKIKSGNVDTLTPW